MYPDEYRLAGARRPYEQDVMVVKTYTASRSSRTPRRPRTALWARHMATRAAVVVEAQSGGRTRAESSARL